MERIIKLAWTAVMPDAKLFSGHVIVICLLWQNYTATAHSCMLLEKAITVLVVHRLPCFSVDTSAALFFCGLLHQSRVHLQ